MAGAQARECRSIERAPVTVHSGGFAGLGRFAVLAPQVHEDARRRSRKQLAICHGRSLWPVDQRRPVRGTRLTRAHQCVRSTAPAAAVGADKAQPPPQRADRQREIGSVLSYRTPWMAGLVRAARDASGCPAAQYGETCVVVIDAPSRTKAALLRRYDEETIPCTALGRPCSGFRAGKQISLSQGCWASGPEVAVSRKRGRDPRTVAAGTNRAF
jgi:hypothetical protein